MPMLRKARPWYSELMLRDPVSIACFPACIVGKTASVNNKTLLAAPPLDVRKGFAFPQTRSLARLRLAVEIGGTASGNKLSDAGKAEPFRTSGGKAAEQSHSPT